MMCVPSIFESNMLIKFALRWPMGLDQNRESLQLPIKAKATDGVGGRAQIKLSAR